MVEIAGEEGVGAVLALLVEMLGEEQVEAVLALGVEMPVRRGL